MFFFSDLQNIKDLNSRSHYLRRQKRGKYNFSHIFAFVLDNGNTLKICGEYSYHKCESVSLFSNNEKKIDKSKKLNEKYHDLGT